MMMDRIEDNIIGALIEPEPIEFMFGAPGWNLLSVVTISLFIIYALLRYRRYRLNRYRRLAIDRVRESQMSKLSTDQQIYRVVDTIKRVSIVSYGREDQVSLSGIEWFNYIKECNRGVPIYSNSCETLLVNRLYRGKGIDISDRELSDIYNETINWIREHHV